jgi:hypothetical protein
MGSRDPTGLPIMGKYDRIILRRRRQDVKRRSQKFLCLRMRVQDAGPGSQLLRPLIERTVSFLIRASLGTGPIS